MTRFVTHKQKYIICVFFVLVSLTIFSYASALTYEDTPPCALPDYKQSDPRWKDTVYSICDNPDQTIKTKGCSLCAAANVLCHFGFDVEPTDLIPIAIQLGTVAWEGGTLHVFYTNLSLFYPVTVTKTSDLDAVDACLDTGGIVIASYSHHAHTLYAHTDEDYWLLNSSIDDLLLSRIMGHMTGQKLVEKKAVFYCYVLNNAK